MKRLIKAMARAIGYEINASRALIGFDLAFDIRRMQLKTPVRTIFDVGANVGNMARYFGHEFPNSTVYAFEPIATTFQSLKTNVGNNPRVELYNFALGAIEEEVTVHLHTKSAQNSLSASINFPSDKRTKTEKVSVKTIDDFCKGANIDQIDLLKTDTEGFDCDVLSGAMNLLQSGNVPLVLAETGFEEAKVNHTRFSEIWAMLEPLGYGVYGMYEISRKGKAKSIFYCNTLFVHEDSVGE